jgi:hypothetical protein
MIIVRALVANYIKDLIKKMVLNFDLQLFLISLFIFHFHSSKASHYTFENSSFLSNIMSCWIQKPCLIMMQMSKIEQFSSTFVCMYECLLPFCEDCTRLLNLNEHILRPFHKSTWMEGYTFNSIVMVW